MPSTRLSTTNLHAYDLDGKMLRLGSTFQCGFAFGGFQLRVERSKFQGEKEFGTATLIDTKAGEGITGWRKRDSSKEREREKERRRGARYRDHKSFTSTFRF